MNLEMNKKMLIAIASLAVVMISLAWASTQSTTMYIPGMSCGACPTTVRTALKRVPGVEKVAVDPAKKSVTVTYDDQKTNVDGLKRAAKNAGYPAADTEKK
ncbi:Mercuric transport protein periplasmic component [Methylacidimicrobium tartarophylax]|uniref:Periplasmic mercury ion-binding protein n=2 Tax=Methylacidimicrobium tartarophylax TaxID=1041768 RepID=A0A5E6MA32_9BACT|nr:Mercuric transport protein periplasmic component [Methylacidimicrobium tartarophylax]